MTSPTRVNTYVALTMVLLVAALFVSPHFTDFAFARNNERPVPAVVAAPASAPQQSVDGVTWSKCTPLNVAVFTKRVHVKCAESVGNVQWFAAPTADATHAARVLSILSTAQAAGKTLDILYDPADLSGGSIGCATSDCRLIQGVAVLK